MPELILSDITVMGQGYCVIGVVETSPTTFRSVQADAPVGFCLARPLPLPAWRLREDAMSARTGHAASF